MGDSKPYIIDLKSLATDKQTFQYVLDDHFFEAVEGSEIKRGSLNVDLTVRKTPDGAFELTFDIKGVVHVPCDRCLEDMAQPIDTRNTLKVRLGSQYADDGEVVEVPERDGTIDVAWNMYEFAALAIPLAHAHADGACNPQMTAALGQLEIEDGDEEAAADETPATDDGQTDPRWDALKKILNNN